MTLRPARLADRASFIALAMRFHAETPYGQLVIVDPDRIGAQFDVAIATGLVLIAERDDEHAGELPIVGFLALAIVIHMLSGDRYAEEMGWFVEQSYRSGTIGPRLLRWAEDWAKREGCVFVVMRSPASSAIGRFYELCGYQAVETAFLKRVA